MMNIMETTTAPAIYQIKATLLGTDPPIWRRLVVPADMSLAKLHKVLQIAMGWQNSHMHEFRAGRRRFGQPEPADPFGRALHVESERRTILSSVLESVGAKMIYTYDFGDNWEHSIVVEKVLAADANASYPFCAEGQHACPPEDCGGIPGFYELLEAHGDSNHERHDELREWTGDDFDPDAFSVEQVNRKLLKIRRRRGGQGLS